ncbi:MAG TPA: sigma factor, partial [Gemmataceae bacterium]|nr:sigma factor [Gemmataceae bacterium]
MAGSPLQHVLHYVRHVAEVETTDELADGELLTRFVSGREEAAFAAMVRRHGAMVLGVCRRMLGDNQAEDAVQATFLVLARRAAAIRKRQSLRCWLYGVACRVARKFRRAAARRPR